MEKNVGQVEKKVEDSERRMEGIMLEEMRAREAIRRNIVIYGMEEQERGTDKEKMEADLTECEKVYTATGVRAGKRDIRFCRRMKSELVKAELLDAAKERQNTRYKHVSIGPDQTKKQKQAETMLNEEVDRKNREELSEEDRSKNLKWMAVGRKGEKRIVKAPVREETERGPYSNGWRNERRGQQHEREQQGRRERNPRRDNSCQPMEEDREDPLSKRTRESGSETEEENGVPPKTRSKH
jgi:hypothetical protein